MVHHVLSLSLIGWTLSCFEELQRSLWSSPSTTMTKPIFNGALHRWRWQNQLSLELSVDDDDKANYQWSSPPMCFRSKQKWHQSLATIRSKGKEEITGSDQSQEVQIWMHVAHTKKKGNHQICKLLGEKERSSIKIQAHIKTRWQGKPCIAHMIQKHGCLTWALHF